MRTPPPSRTSVGAIVATTGTMLGAADALEVPLVGLLGSTEYYPRFHGRVPRRMLAVGPEVA